MSYYEHFETLEYDYNDSSSGLGSGLNEYGAEFVVPCDQELLSPSVHRVILPVVYGFIFTLGIIGNGLVIFVLGCQRKARLSLTDRYRLHLSAADLLFVLALPFWAVDSALANWCFGAVWCVGVHVIYTVNLYGSVLILAFISLDRYMAVVKATDTSTTHTRQLLARRLVYAGAWLPAGLLAIPDIVFARTQEGGEGEMVCTRLYPPEKSLLWVSLFQLQTVVMGLVLPALVLLVCYCVIVSRLTRGPLGGQRQKRKAVKTTVALVLCFFLCWLPYCIGITVDALLRLELIPGGCMLQSGLGVWITVSEPMAFAHCCLNPLLYAFLGTGFKSSARRALALTRTSSLKILPRRRTGAMTSTTTESESSSLHSS
ncbi:hypothetical protein UPYG_G00294180 [Umbra pygmaea]|uniref:G-protein coupled receptors family 1 profile domain-containing protein n=1 Tax=Umbra pygmaea TaxID=75934 RepID=A0ABD0W9K1_UMBPY